MCCKSRRSNRVYGDDDVDDVVGRVDGVGDDQ